MRGTERTFGREMNHPKREETKLKTQHANTYEEKHRWRRRKRDIDEEKERHIDEEEEESLTSEIRLHPVKRKRRSWQLLNVWE